MKKRSKRPISYLIRYDCGEETFSNPYSPQYQDKYTKHTSY